MCDCVPDTDHVTSPQPKHNKPLPTSFWLHVRLVGLLQSPWMQRDFAFFLGQLKSHVDSATLRNVTFWATVNFDGDFGFSTLPSTFSRFVHHREPRTSQPHILLTFRAGSTHRCTTEPVGSQELKRNQQSHQVCFAPCEIIIRPRNGHIRLK